MLGEYNITDILGVVSTPEFEVFNKTVFVDTELITEDKPFYNTTTILGPVNRDKLTIIVETFWGTDKVGP
jgi:hypothetical protein